MNFFRKLLFIIFSLVIANVPLKSMEQKELNPNSIQTKIFIFPYAFVNSRVQLFGGSKNLQSWKPFETKISHDNRTFKSFIMNLEFKIAKTLHYQTLGLFAHYEIKLQDALDLEKGINYFLDKFGNEEIYYINASWSTAIFFIEVPYINSFNFNYQQQKFLERIEKAKKQKKDFPEFFKKNNFGWIGIDEIYQDYHTLDLTEFINDPLLKELVSAIKARSQESFILGLK